MVSQQDRIRIPDRPPALLPASALPVVSDGCGSDDIGLYCSTSAGLCCSDNGGGDVVTIMFCVGDNDCGFGLIVDASMIACIVTAVSALLVIYV